LLHLADNITQMGPVWCYWAFPMERFCGSLLPAVKSRKHPYICLNHRVRDIAQLNQIKLLYNLTDQLDLSEQRASMATGIVPNNCTLYNHHITLKSSVLTLDNAILRYRP
ncbi:hypothetical protein BC834DRAFT_825984, partial [Gloeopeniophorella convolvens]